MKQGRHIGVAAWVWITLCACGLPAKAALQTNLPCVADTTLSENYTNHNLGGLTHVNVGVTQNGTRGRGLYRFDVAGAMPPSAKVVSAALVLEVELVPTEGIPFAGYELHRMLQPWGEGSGTSDRGQGAPALTNEANWYYRFAFTTNTWAAPGGAATNDYVAAASASQMIYGPENSPYTFGPNGPLTADVQFWLDHPEANHGWMLICPDEATAWSARRFGSRESTTFPPRLEVHYLVAPQIDQAERVGSQFNLSFRALPGQSYAVQFSTSLPPSAWQPLANVGSPPVVTRVLVVDPIAPTRRFYRVMAY
jgi:hypothetical protein